MTSTALAASVPESTGTAPHPEGSADGALSDLLERGRSQGHLSLSELRTAFSAAGVTSADGRSILRELTENGVRLANGGDDTVLVADADAEDDVLENTLIATVPETDEAPKAATGKVATRKGPSASRRKTRTTRRTTKKTETTQTGTDPETGEADLDDQSPAMGDSVHTYLKAIGRRQLLTAEQEVDLAKRVEAGLYAEYRLGQHGPIDDSVEMAQAEIDELEWVAEDGRLAKSHMLEANLRLVVSVAKKYSDRGMSLLDVVQEGNLGLIRAVEKFDYSKGFKFSTYAMWWIRQAIQRGFADSARTIRLPVHVLELLSKVSRLERDMHQALGREPTPEELGLELDKTPAQIEELLRVTRQPISLDSTIGEDGETRIGDLIEDVDASEASEVVDRQLMADQLRNALSDLEPREATIMSLRFGLMDGRPRTLDEIGKHLGLTRERIRQLEKQSLSKLRHPSRAQQLLDFAS
ncbi:RNA polymerase primary sigma factor [Nocardiopsis sp. Huas11]|uniref:sigma-70 family RNA polymerase sigma factor n=1 Tax=Nocardiopsis sp. Huas11 TaxID=2183912 RepID=UPI000EB030D6|nr:sigma-70 family RNA polymerase sigma factor [Nocardiopsis sp. Huas11]RKS08257.1 RNA polymerase primary sigma factor [Nocardiopsis sp. Huas11]